MEKEIKNHNDEKTVQSRKVVKRANRELVLKEKIEKAKAEITRLREKRIQECGKLAVKYKIHLAEDSILADSFKRLSRSWDCEHQKKSEASSNC